MTDEIHELLPKWEYVADTVMGGVSCGTLRTETVEERTATRLTGQVSLENGGGFLQMAADTILADGVDPSEWAGIEVEILGNRERYEMRLRTTALTRPWQSFRTGFEAPAAWTTLRFPFSDFTPHRTEAVFDPSELRRIGLLAVGREMEADIAVAAIRLFR